MHPDVVAVRLAARLRVALAIATAATGSFIAVEGRHAVLFLILGLAWVPWSCVVLFSADGPIDLGWQRSSRSRRLALLGGPIGDTCALLAVQLLMPEASGAVLLGYLAVVVFAAYTVSWLFSGALGLFAVAAALLAPAGRSPLGGTAIAVFAMAAAALVGLVDRTTLLQRRTEARSEQLQSKSDVVLARIADAVVVTDASGTVLQWNPAAERLLAPPVRSEVRCEALLALHHGERPLTCSSRCGLLATLEPDDRELGVEVWRHDPTGRRQPLLANAEIVRGPDGNVAEVVHSLRDITKLKQADEAKTLFLATASHELKTPLTVINGFVETVLSADLPPEQRLEALDAVRRRARELNKIVDRLLLSSRIEAGRVHINIGQIVLQDIVEERAAALEAATGRHVALELASVPPVEGEPGAITTVVDHLLDNAVKYSPGGEPVTVSLEEGEGEVRLVVADQGIGMDREQAAHCFDKFWQGESTDVRRFGGTGIGLYIVKSLTDAMGADISVRSELGGGSVFTVRFSVRHAPTVPDSGEASSIREFMRQLGIPQAPLIRSSDEGSHA